MNNVLLVPVKFVSKATASQIRFVKPARQIVTNVALPLHVINATVPISSINLSACQVVLMGHSLPLAINAKVNNSLFVLLGINEL